MRARQPLTWGRTLALSLLGAIAADGLLQGQARDQRGDAFRFKSGVEVINVTATVYDANGRFVPNLRRDDFVIYDDDREQEVTAFSADRIPVSLGILLDTSGSMAGEKIDAARGALDGFVGALLTGDDEAFLYRFDDTPQLLQGWTNDRRVLSRILGRVTPRGGTAMYDALNEALPFAAGGRFPKKALVVISDGNDTSSSKGPMAVTNLARANDVLIYAVGIDAESIVPDREDAPDPKPFGPEPGPTPKPPTPRRLPPIIRVPGGRRPAFTGANQIRSPQADAHVDAAALRRLTDDTGGRTEIIRSVRDLRPATTSISNELSRQYQFAYNAPGYKDGTWHTIRVEVKRAGFTVRSRKGYLAN